MNTLLFPLLLFATQPPGPAWDDPDAEALVPPDPLPEPAPPPAVEPSATPPAVIEAPAPPPAPARQAEPSTLTGTVRERGTDRPLEGITVLVDGEPLATTDRQGRFSLAAPAGAHVITLLDVDYGQTDEELSLLPGRTLDKVFTLAPGEIGTVTVVEKAPLQKREASQITLAHAEISTVPGTFGDPVRVIENLPGMSRAPGGMGGALIVRGANPADTGVYVDGVWIPLLYHFGGLTSVINADLLGGITFLPGGFGAEHGRATAGVVNAETAPLRCDRVRASAAVDPMDAELFGCFPVGRWRIAAAARRSYIDAFLPAVLEAAAGEGEEPTIISPAYFDYQVKAETVRSNHRLSLFAFGADDRLEVVRAASAEDNDVRFGGALAFHRLLARHEYFVGKRFVLASSLTPGFLRQDFSDASADLGTQHRSGVDVYTLDWRETATFRLNERLMLRGGLDHVLTHWQADFLSALPNLGPRFPSPLPFDSRTQSPWRRSRTGFDQAYWAEAAIGLTDALTVTPGLRFAHLVFDSTRRTVLEPRAAVRWEAGEGTAFTAAGGIYRKLPDMFSGVIVDGFGQPNLDAERAMHLVGGVEQRLGPLETKLEAFSIRRDRLPSPTAEVEIRDGKAQPVLFRSDGRGRSYGAELLVRLPAQERRRFSGWVAYTLSRSLRSDRTPTAGGLDQYDQADPGTPRLGEIPTDSEEYLSPFDQTHILTAVARWELPWNMSLGGRFQLVSGNPTTPLDRGQTFYDADADRYTVRAGSVARNSDRLPANDRLDLRLDKRWDFARWRLTAYLEVINGYNRRPVEAQGYDYRYQTRTPLRGLPILPLLGIKGEI